jgi:hypothetical protein
MKKIMFNDKYDLTKAVLEGRKTMTRRLVHENVLARANEYVQKVHGTGHDFLDYLLEHPLFEAGEVVAVAQAYRDAINPLDWVNTLIYKDEPGWTNKMFVGADLMPHRIFINAVRVERLQDISDEDCLREGIYDLPSTHGDGKTGYFFPNCPKPHNTSREAFAALIDKVSGMGTWESNPYVFVYEFELVK